MKPLFLVLLGTVCLPAVIFSPTAFAQAREVIERGPNYRVIQTAAGHRYTEFQNCLHYLDENGQWQESQEIIELTAQGAAAQRGPSKV